MSKNWSWRKLLVLMLLLLGLSSLWFRGGFDHLHLNTDLGRDLTELSQIWQGNLVWLGPRLSPGLHASSFFYYSLFPALWVASGDARGLVIFNLSLAAVVLGSFGWYGWKTWGRQGLLAMLTIGLLPWWQTTAPHVGNGYTYALWLFLGLTTLWFELPFFITAFAVGMATALHPVAVVAVPLLVIEWWRQRPTWRVTLFSVVSFLIPWSPLIAFEVITRGYIVRQWLSQPHAAFTWHWTTVNLTQITQMLGIESWLAISTWIITLLIGGRRQKIWWGVTTLSLLIWLGTGPAHSHYLLAALCLISFVTIVTLIQIKWGVALVAMFTITLFVRSTLLATPPATVSRTIPSVQHTVEALTQTGQLDKTHTIAVVAILSHQVEVPQADDYRFFLRMKGYPVLDVQQYSQADQLVLFVEVPNFPWQTWSSWETDQFGSKKIQYQTKINQTEVMVFGKN